MYRSGYNGADSKSVREQSLGGSNPSISATTTKLLPDHIEFTQNIASTRPYFNDFIFSMGLSTASGETLECEEMVINEIWTSVRKSILITLTCIKKFLLCNHI